MAQDYDSPRNKDEDEESLQALGKSSQNTSNDMDDDENASLPTPLTTVSRCVRSALPDGVRRSI